MKITDLNCVGPLYTNFFSINLVLENSLLDKSGCGRRADYGTWEHGDFGIHNWFWKQSAIGTGVGMLKKPSAVPGSTVY